MARPASSWAITCSRTDEPRPPSSLGMFIGQRPSSIARRRSRRADLLGQRPPLLHRQLVGDELLFGEAARPRLQRLKLGRQLEIHGKASRWRDPSTAARAMTNGHAEVDRRAARTVAFSHRSRWFTADSSWSPDGTFAGQVQRPLPPGRPQAPPGRQLQFPLLGRRQDAVRQDAARGRGSGTWTTTSTSTTGSATAR